MIYFKIRSFFLNILKKYKKDEWVSCNLGYILYENNPYEFGFEPIYHFLHASGQFLPICPLCFYCTKEQKFFINDDAIKHYDNFKKEYFIQRQQELDKFIMTNIKLIPKDIIAKYQIIKKD